MSEGFHFFSCHWAAIKEGLAAGAVEAYRAA
jgi:hypothetical protein